MVHGAMGTSAHALPYRVDRFGSVAGLVRSGTGSPSGTGTVYVGLLRQQRALPPAGTEP